MDADPKTGQFGWYFTKEYLNRKEEWAYCYRIGLGINTNMKLERFFGIFKERFLGRKANARVDELIFRLIQYSKYKLQDLLLKQTKGKTTDLIHKNNQIHTRSTQIPSADIQRLGPTTWSVFGSTSNSKYIIKRTSQFPCPQPCSAGCTKCGTCIHMYLCSCPHNVFGNMCKHIHAVHSQCTLDNETTISSASCSYFAHFPQDHAPSAEHELPSVATNHEQYQLLKSELDELLRSAGQSSNDVSQIAVDYLSKAKSDIVRLLTKRPENTYGITKKNNSRRCAKQPRFN